MKWLRAVIVIGLCLGGIACRRHPSPVRSTLEEMAAEARERNADALVAHLSTSFRASDGSGRGRVREQLRRYFGAYEVVDVSLGNLAVEQGGNAVQVRFVAKLSGQSRKVGGLEGLVPSSSSYRFEMRFIPEDEEWKVAWASWTPER